MEDRLRISNIYTRGVPEENDVTIGAEIFEEATTKKFSNMKKYTYLQIKTTLLVPSKINEFTP